MKTCPVSGNVQCHMLMGINMMINVGSSYCRKGKRRRKRSLDYHVAHAKETELLPMS